MYNLLDKTTNVIVIILSLLANVKGTRFFFSDPE